MQTKWRFSPCGGKSGNSLPQPVTVLDDSGIGASIFRNPKSEAETLTMIQMFRLSTVLTICCMWAATSTAEELSPSALSSVGLEARWVAQAVLNINRDHMDFLTNDEELVYAESSAGVLTAFNAENGRKMWASQVGLNDAHGMAPVTNRDTLLIVSGPNVHGLNKFTGDELFVYRLPGQPTTTPGMDASSFFIPLTDGSMAGFSLKTLAHLERYGQLPPGVSRPMAWRFVSGERSVFPPVAGDQLIALATEAGSLHGVSGKGTTAGRTLYQLLLRSPMTAPLTYVNKEEGEMLLAASQDNRIFCLRLSKGANMMWTYPMGSSMTEALMCVDDSVFVVTEGDGLTTLSLTQGLPLRLEDGKPWFVPSIEAVLAVTETRVYTVDVTQRLTILNRKTGAVEGRLPIPGHSIRIRNNLTDRIYLSTESGGIMCLAEKGSQFASYHQNPDRQPVMPGIPDTDPVQTEESADSP